MYIINCRYTGQVCENTQEIKPRAASEKGNWVLENYIIWVSFFFNILYHMQGFSIAPKIIYVVMARGKCVRRVVSHFAFSGIVYILKLP